MIGYNTCNEKMLSTCCCWYWNQGFSFKRKW